MKKAMTKNDNNINNASNYEKKKDQNKNRNNNSSDEYNKDNYDNNDYNSNNDDDSNAPRDMILTFMPANFYILLQHSLTRGHATQASLTQSLY